MEALLASEEGGTMVTASGFFQECHSWHFPGVRVRRLDGDLLVPCPAVPITHRALG